MTSSILGIGQTALTAAQAGLNTTSHNIANSATPGYSRQLVIQGTAGGQNFGFGFIGKGTGVDDVRRVYSDYLGAQVTTAQTSKYQLDTYLNQISRINNQFADPSAGMTPAMQDFFKGTQDVASDPNSGAARQSLISSAQSMTARFQSLNGQLDEMRQGVNSQLSSVVNEINVYAKQLADLNNAIEVAQGADGHPANDLLDQRDQVISDLSKDVQVSIVKQGNSYSAFIGTGQPLVVGGQIFKLVAAPSPTDLSRTEVGYTSNGTVTVLSESGLTGGKLGGLFDFRTNSLDVSQNSLGRVAIGLGMTFNAQHQLGQDQNGALGGAFFNVGSPLVKVNSANPAGDAIVTATISNPGALTISDYDVQITAPSTYRVTRLSDGVITNIAPPTTLPQTIDGVDFNMSAGPQTVGDNFVVKPTANGAAAISVAVTDPTKVAAAAPIRTAAASTNVGSGKISAAVVSSTATLPQTTLTFASPANTLTMSLPALSVTVTPSGGGAPTTYPAGAPVPYTDGATISYGGVSFVISGSPANGDTFTTAANTSGVGDNRNALLLGALQSANTLANGTITYQGAYSQLVNLVGNKTRELEVTSTAQGKLLAQAVQSQQSESGVNLDEEATNLIRYQQAYQAAGKVMQTANTLFDVLMQLGN